ncbi:pathogenesis-related protein 1 [Moniliophthora roreri]|uniref:Pathogenesis-related protein 1 n=1 Tax=Moniliophthora roreri TaxID=221103 RepID=A0A0W0FM08_MONRR|nr:pathogenesis-related protein 1 [Moniliophthora roreri]QVT77482.1 pathogenesis-related protein 1 [Moniliophthora roreri]QVT77483.1 pathogenesis-related protein 1 [Moniliophthora roreri]QVT77491.1 pathogenesis-related protein 1 [Moniliophthora roreri]
MHLNVFIPLLSLSLAWAAPASTTPNSDDFSNSWLNAHNAERAQHGASALTWSKDVASAAQDWANQCNLDTSSAHYGENIAWGGGQFTPESAVNLWLDSKKDYNPQNPSSSSWTQIVWKSTNELGCAQAKCSQKNGDNQDDEVTFYVCYYNPPGNVRGQYSANVQP